MTRVSPRTMSGVLELLPQEQISFQRMLDQIRQGFERFAFSPIETPLMELTDVLLTKEGGDTERQVYFAQSTGAQKQKQKPTLALRFDLTVPLARYVAQHEGELAFPFRRYQIQRVYRGESAQRGRFREFYQCDLDIIARNSLNLRYDAEIPAVIYHIFKELGVGKFTIALNNRKLLMGLFKALGVAQSAQGKLILREIDKLKKRGQDYLVNQLMSESLGLTESQVNAIVEFLELSKQDSVIEALNSLGERTVKNEMFKTGVHELSRVLAVLKQLNVPQDFYNVDFSIVRGLDYYTGTVYETTLDNYEALGSVCSGGRYENLASLYTATKLPGVGLSIGATRLFYQLRELGFFDHAVSCVQVFIAQFDQELQTDYLRLGTELRSEGFNTEVSFLDKPLKKQLKYANRANIPIVIILGKDEKSKNIIRVKNMINGAQTDVKPVDLVSKLREWLQ